MPRGRGREPRVDIAAWLHSLGMQQYEAAFRKNAIDAAILPELTTDDLKDLGVTLVGHRGRLFAAIAALHRDVAAAAELAAFPAPGRSSPIPSPPRARPGDHGRGKSGCRTPSADGDVLRSGRLDGTLGAARP